MSKAALLGREVRLDVGDEESAHEFVRLGDGNIPEVSLPHIIVSGVNDVKDVEEIEEEVKENCLKSFKKIQKAMNVSRFPLKVSIALLAVYAVVFALSCYFLDYARGIAITNICMAMVTKFVGKVLQFKPMQKRIEEKLQTLERTASEKIKAFLDEFVRPLHAAQKSVKEKMDDVESVLENEKVVEALHAASIAGFDADAPLALVEEIDGYVDEAGKAIEHLVSIANSIRSFVKLAARFNGAIAAFAAVYILASSGISAGIYYTNSSGDAGVAVAVNAAIGFGVFLVTLLEHWLITWILKRIVAAINCLIERFESMVNEKLRSKLGGGEATSIASRITRAGEVEAVVSRVAKAAKAASFGKGLVGGVKKIFKGLL